MFFEQYVLPKMTYGSETWALIMALSKGLRSHRMQWSELSLQSPLPNESEMSRPTGDRKLPAYLIELLN